MTREVEPTDATPIADLRHRIDSIDDRLLRLVAERLQIAEELGEAKRRADLAGRDPEREAQIVARLAATGDVPPDLVALIWQGLFTASRWVQQRPG